MIIPEEGSNRRVPPRDLAHLSIHVILLFLQLEKVVLQDIWYTEDVE